MHTISGSTVRNAGSTIPLELLFSTLVTSFAGQPGPNLDGTRMIIDEVRVYDRPGFLGSVSGNFGSDANWGNGSYPRINDAAIFNRPVANTTVTVAGASKEAREIYFDHPDLPGFTFIPRSDFPDAVLRLGSGGAAGITMNNTVPSTQVFDVPIVTLKRLALSNFSLKPDALLDLRGPISAETPGEGVLFFNDGPVVLSGVIDASIGQVDKFGLGEATLAATNQHTGVTRIARGTLLVAADGALGSIDERTETASGGTLSLADIDYLTPEPLLLAGAGSAGSAGALEARGEGASSFVGPITLGANTTVGARHPNGSLRITGPVGATSSPNLSIAGPGLTEIAGPISSLSNIFVRDHATALLTNPANSSSGTGTVYVVAGTLLVGADAPNNSPGALGSSSWRVRVGSTQSQETDNAALLTHGPVTIGRPLQIEPNNRLGVSKIGGNTADVSIFSGSVFLDRELTIQSVEGGEVIFQGALVNLNSSGSIRKTGPGVVRLAAVNTFTGTTTVAEGLLKIEQAGALPGATTLIIESDGVFDMAGHMRTINGFILAGGELIDSSNLTSTLLALSGDQPFDLRSGSVHTRLGGTRGLLKTTTGRVTLLNNNNTFQGPVTIAEGILAVDGALNGPGAVGVTGGWLSGTGTIAGSVSVGAGGLEFALDSDPSTHKSLSVNGALGFDAGSRVRLLIGEDTEPGNYMLVAVGGGVTGPLPELDLPSGWSGELETTSGALRVTLERASISGIAAWRLYHFGDGEPVGDGAKDADPDGDGIPNLLEYALGGHPLSPNTAVLPKVQIEEGKLSLTFNRQSDPRIAYRVEAGDLLEGIDQWTTIWESSDQANVEEEVTVSDTVTFEGRSTRFLRLRVEYIY